MNNTENYILCISEHKSITKAAQSLGISQPALSSSLASLENKLGFAIFDRSTTPITTTPEGDAYLDYLRKLHLLKKNLHEQISDIQNKQNTTISVGAPASYVETTIIPAISTFLKSHPNANFILTEGTASFLLEKMKQGEIDIFLSTSQVLSDEFSYVHLGTEQTYLCVPSNSKWATYSQISLDEISDENFIFLHTSQPLQQIVDNYLNSQNIKLHCNIRVDQVSSAIKFVEMGYGLCFVTNNALTYQNNYNRMKLIPFSDNILSRNLYAVTIHQKYMSEYQKKFIDILKKESR